MKKTFATIFVFVLLLQAGTFFLATPASAALSLLDGVPCAHQPNTPYPLASNDCGLCDAIHVLVNASNMIIAFSGALAMIMFMYAGIMMIIYYAHPAGLAKAKDTIKWTIIGLLVIFSGYTVINFTLMTFGGDVNMGAIASSYQKVTDKTIQQWGVCQNPTVTN